mmetsp:Transcript_45995/g.80815  ORF Transcript_45995/g.80815 Transcript_45995/m.80815 type:complete len:330 (+) Transcript_45995:114-1103(+)
MTPPAGTDWSSAAPRSGEPDATRHSLPAQVPPFPVGARTNMGLALTLLRPDASGAPMLVLGVAMLGGRTCPRLPVAMPKLPRAGPPPGGTGGGVDPRTTATGAALDPSDVRGEGAEAVATVGGSPETRQTGECPMVWRVPCGLVAVVAGGAGGAAANPEAWCGAVSAGRTGLLPLERLGVVVVVLVVWGTGKPETMLLVIAAAQSAAVRIWTGGGDVEESPGELARGDRRCTGVAAPLVGAVIRWLPPGIIEAIGVCAPLDAPGGAEEARVTAEHPVRCCSCSTSTPVCLMMGTIFPATLAMPGAVVAELAAVADNPAAPERRAGDEGP